MNRGFNITPLVVLFDDADDTTGRVLVESVLPASAHFICVANKQCDGVDGEYWLDGPRGECIRSLLERAQELSCSHIVTIDLQDLPYVQALPQLFKVVESEPAAIFVACRSRSGTLLAKLLLYFRRYLHNMWVRFYTGAEIADAASTFRLYPVSELSKLELKAKGYEVEQEVLLKASWNGVLLHDFPVEESRVENCRKRRGIAYSCKVSLIWLKAFFHRFVSPFSGAPVPGDTFRVKVKNLIMHELRSNTSAQKASFSVALGVYFGLLPIHGFQLVALLFVTTKLRCNRPLAFLGVNVSIAPLLPLVFYCSLTLGSLFTGSGLSVSLGDKNLLEKGITYGLDFVLGSIVLAHSMALLTYVVLSPMFQKMKKESR